MNAHIKKDGNLSGNETSTSSLDLSRRQVVRGAAATAASAVLSGFAPLGCSAAVSPSAAPPSVGQNSQPKPTGPLTEASLTVTSTAAGSIGPAFAGLSYEKLTLNYGVFTSANTDLIGLFKRIGPNVLRIGGDSVDQNVWTPNGSGETPGQIAPSDVNGLAAFVKAAGWQCLYGVNLAGAATGATTPTLAAEEVAYAAQQFGSSLLGIEIGNEPNVYGDTGHPFAGNWSISQFITLWEQFRNAIHAQTPGVPITGPAAAYSSSTWAIPFGQTVKNEITLLTQHYYRGDGQSPIATAQYLLSPDSSLVGLLADIEACSQSIGVPYRIAECNSLWNGGSPNVSNAYASSLWVIDFLFDCSLGGATGVNLHGGGNSTNGSPIASNGATVVEARPEYYGVLLFELAGQGSLQVTQLSAGSINATAYAVKASSGGLNIVVVNKDQTQNLDLTVDLPQQAHSATLICMTQLSSGATGPDLSALGGVTIQGASVGLDGSLSPDAAYNLNPNGTQLTCFVPALSAVLIKTP